MKLVEMTKQHSNLSQTKWNKLSFLEKMGNIGSEVCRAIKWKEKQNKKYAELAFLRSLELIDLSLNSTLTYSQLRELARSREAWVDFFYYDNQYNTTAEQWTKYFDQLLMALRLKQNSDI